MAQTGCPGAWGNPDDFNRVVIANVTPQVTCLAAVLKTSVLFSQRWGMGWPSWEGADETARVVVETAPSELTETSSACCLLGLQARNSQLPPLAGRRPSRCT